MSEWHALALQHRIELDKREITIMRYRTLLEEHGIEPPDDSGEAALAELDTYRAMIQAGVDFMDAADELRRRLGTSKELLAKDSWR